MSEPQCKLLFDECISRPSIEELARLIELARGDRPRIMHLFAFCEPGTRDDVWIPRLASEDWTIVTGDGGRNPSRGEKLPNVCAKLGVTHVILSPAVQTRTSFDKLLTILSVWYELLDIASDPARRGGKFVIEPNTHAERGKGRMIPRPIPEHLLKARDELRRQSAGEAGSSEEPAPDRPPAE